jgi:hypothetical protein
MERTEEEIQEQIDKAMEQRHTDPGKWSGMSYEQGVEDALEWVLGSSDDAPMDEG